MYVGRFLVAAPGLAAYRVSSRSFPNRKVIERDGSLTVVPTGDAEPTDNPYVSYNCVRGVARADEGDEQVAVIGNGSHVDPVAEKVGMGYPARDALASALLALDYEKDDYDTPRIAAVVAADTAFIGTVRKDALVVREVDEPTLVATYGKDDPEPFALEAGTADTAARELYDHAFEHAISAAGVAVDGGGVETAIHNGE
ncbi:IMP cyclohydrolase [Halolamina salifodinae]|uniref:IMP cyclohydrolase n=1 Tax=Halolamina salifodinae TaxID=1202767 RepID=A0A8T4GTX0_9EURY|nr:IMP cyclohydrolase [Halolamina salifodinae]MBP1985840.1 IMP cyclohydrolase [Halolamina salifodinae]